MTPAISPPGNPIPPIRRKPMPPPGVQSQWADAHHGIQIYPPVNMRVNLPGAARLPPHFRLKPGDIQIQHHQPRGPRIQPFRYPQGLRLIPRCVNKPFRRQTRRRILPRRLRPGPSLCRSQMMNNRQSFLPRPV